MSFAIDMATALDIYAKIHIVKGIEEKVVFRKPKIFMELIWTFYSNFGFGIKVFIFMIIENCLNPAKLLPSIFSD